MSKLSVSLSPHINSPRTTAGIMLDVLIALLPTSVAGIVIFGLRALAVLAVSVAVAVLSEFLFSIITKRPQTVGDLSAAVTGLLLGLNLPYNTPLWQVAVGSVFAVICVKCLFGGIGQNFANPAITARIFMLVAFTNLSKVDAAIGATPLADLKAGKELPLLDLFIGDKGGAIGEVCIAALLVGGIYLVVRRVINPTTPLVYVATSYLFTLALVGGDLTEALAWTLSGGLMIGAIFMATDYSTTPTTSLGKAVFGIGAGLITVLIRFYGSYPEGVSFAILLMNILTPYIDRLTARVPFGGKVK
jgi:electron transport complex protein RnfD